MTEHRIDDNGEHVEKLEGRLRALAAGFSEAGSSDDFDELYKIIHRPPFTTPIELELIHLIVDTAERNLAEAAALRGALVQGARAIVEESAVTA
jgi:hypothetical protein